MNPKAISDSSVVGTRCGARRIPQALLPGSLRYQFASFAVAAITLLAFGCACCLGGGVYPRLEASFTITNLSTDPFDYTVTDVNGQMTGVASPVTPDGNLSQQYTNYPQEYRFN